MPEEYTTPGVHIEEVPARPPPIEGVRTSVAAFVGLSPTGETGTPVALSGWRGFEEEFGGLWEGSGLGFAVRDFFANGGVRAFVLRLPGEEPGSLTSADFVGPGFEQDHRGLFGLDRVEPFGLLVIPPYTPEGGLDDGVVAAAAYYCARRRAMLLLDAPPQWSRPADVVANLDRWVSETLREHASYVAMYHPRLRQPDPLHGDRVGTFSATGAVAGVIARTDAQRGVWKAPAGTSAVLTGVMGLETPITATEVERLSQMGVNCLRVLPGIGPVVWGARTLAREVSPEWKYVSVRRTSMFLEHSIEGGLQWVVFEPNGEPLWASIRLAVDAFLHGLFRGGALQGSTADEAYFVRCDRSTMTQADIDAGRIVVVVGFAPMKPAEFVVIRFQMRAARPA